MRPAQGRHGWVLAGSLLLAWTAGAIEAYDYQTASLSRLVWAGGAILGVVGAASIWFSRMALPASTVAGWRMAALSFALIAPTACESIQYRSASCLAVVALCMAATFRFFGSRKGVVGEALCMAGACALTFTALAMPLGAALHAVSRRRGVPVGLAVLALSILAAALAGMLWRAPITSYRNAATAHLVHQDLVLMLPILVLGLGGWASPVQASPDGETPEVQQWLHCWTVVSLPALVLAFVGYPFDVRVAMLPLCYWMPAGFEDLALGIQRRRGAVATAVGALSAALLVVLFLPVFERWLQGLLMTLAALD